MLTDPLYKRSFILLIFIAAMHITAIKFDIYYEVWWFDNIMHFLGGVWVALTSFWLYNTSRFTRRFFGPSKPLIVALFSIVVIGILWEVYEYLTDQTYSMIGYYLDTAKDLVVDLIGAVVATMYAAKYTQKK